MNKIIALMNPNDKNFAKIKVRNISEIHYYCQNYYHRYRFTLAKTYQMCKNCGVLICKDCAKNDYSKCVTCSQNNIDNLCNLCKEWIRKYMCHICGNIIIRCSLECIKNMTLILPNCGYGYRCNSCYKYDVKCNFCKN